MENNYNLKINITKFYNRTDDGKILAINFFFGIFSLITTLLSIISIFIIIFQKGKKNIRQKIQIMLCFSFIGIEIRFYPIYWENELYFYILNCISLSFIVLSNYFQFIYSYIAYKLFISPDDLSSKYNKFIIYFFPLILFIFLIIIMTIRDTNLELYFSFIVFLKRSYNSIIIFGVCRLSFFVLNIIYIGKLLKRIKYISINSISIDKKFAETKYSIYKDILIKYIIGMSIVAIPYMLKDIMEHFYPEKDPLNNNNFFAFFFFGIECLSGLIYWIIYIYNKNLLRRFLIIFCCKNESNYVDNFIEEKKYYEESAKMILTASTCTDMTMLTSVNEEEYKKEFKVDSQENVVESLTDDETL